MKSTFFSFERFLGFLNRWGGHSAGLSQVVEFGIGRDIHFPYARQGNQYFLQQITRILFVIVIFITTIYSKSTQPWLGDDGLDPQSLVPDLCKRLDTL